MTTIVAINLLEKYCLDKCNYFCTLETAIRISKTSAALNGTTAQLKFGKWLRL